MQAMHEHRLRTDTILEDQAKRDIRLDENYAPSVLDCSIKVKYKLDLSEKDLHETFHSFGEIDQIILSSKGKKNAVVVFESIIAAVTIFSFLMK